LQHGLPCWRGAVGFGAGVRIGLYENTSQ